MNRLATFFRLWTWFSFRQLRGHLWRTIAVLVGIGLGAAVFTSVRLAVNASLDSFTRSLDTLSGKSDWTILRPDGRVPESLISTLVRHPAVKALSPLSTTYVQAVDDAASGPLLLIGLDPILDRSIRTWQSDSSGERQSSPAPKSEARKQRENDPARSSSGQASSLWLDLIREPFTLIAGGKLHSRLQLQADHPLTLDHPGGRRTFRVLGKLAPEGLALLEGQ